MRKQNNYQSGLIRSWLQSILSAIFFGLMICAGYWGWLKLQNPHALPFRDIKISASADHIDAMSLKNIVLQHIDGGFFSLHMSVLKQSLLDLPWVQSVSIRRVWPSTLNIFITEQEAFAQWGDKQLINRNGQLFQPPVNTMPANLPQLQGPDGSVPIMLNQFQFMAQQLALIGMSMQKLILDDRLAWSVLLKNGMTIFLGHHDVNQKMALFVQLYPRLIGDRGAQVETVDLRYSNGLAIKWRTSPTLSATSPTTPDQ